MWYIISKSNWHYFAPIQEEWHIRSLLWFAPGFYHIGFFYNTSKYVEIFPFQMKNTCISSTLYIDFTVNYMGIFIYLYVNGIYINLMINWSRWNESIIWTKMVGHFLQKEILRKTPLRVGWDNWMASVMIILCHKKLTEIDITRKITLFTNTATSRVFVIIMYIFS